MTIDIAYRKPSQPERQWRAFYGDEIEYLEGFLVILLLSGYEVERYDLPNFDHGDDERRTAYGS